MSCLNEKGNYACDNGKNNNDHKIYASMTRMSSNDERSSENYGDSLQLTNWILDSEAEISDLTSGSLEDTYKYIEVEDIHHDTAKQKCQVQIQMCEDNVKSFIATLHNVLLAPDLGNRLFSIITLMNSGHTFF